MWLGKKDMPIFQLPTLQVPDGLEMVPGNGLHLQRPNVHAPCRPIKTMIAGRARGSRVVMRCLAAAPDLFRPEEVSRVKGNPSGDRPAKGGGRARLSLKAVFWCAAAIAISLALGNLS
jgi:hypothetical protein